MHPLSSPPPRGQSLVLVSMTLLFLTLMVLMTVGLGVTAARKADLNNLADAAAYSAAVETARTFNAAAMLNRAIVAHYVTLAGIEAQMAYVSEGHAMFNLAGTMFRMFDMKPPGGGPVKLGDAFDGLWDPPEYPSSCPERTFDIRDGSYEMWHAALYYFSPSPFKYAGDAVDGVCHGHGVRGIPEDCTTRRTGIGYTRPDGWNLEPLGKLELKAGRELLAAHRAIHDLATIERETYQQLIKNVGTGELAEDLAKTAKLDDNLKVLGRSTAKDELNDATDSTPNGARYDPDRSKSFEHSFAEAVLGSRPRETLVLPGDRENIAPLLKQMKDFADASFRTYPGGQVHFVTFTPGDVSADYTFAEQSTYGERNVREEPLAPLVADEDIPVLVPGMGFSYARSQRAKVVVRYFDACGKTTRTIRSGEQGQYPDPVTGQRYEVSPMGVIVRGAKRGEALHSLYESGYQANAHYLWPNPPQGCHDRHATYGGEELQDVHGFDTDTFPSEILGYVLARPSDNEKGAHGLWGQPVVPIVLTRRFPLANDPWALDSFRFRFRDGSDVDLAKASRSMMSAAAGVAHYHRRQHLGEPPNMLNPFWRATLQPMEIDQRSEKFDPTHSTRNTSFAKWPLAKALDDSTAYRDAKQAREAYREVRSTVHGMVRQPGDEDGVVE